MAGPRAFKLALVLVALILPAGCSHTEVVGSDHTLHVAISEYRLNPTKAKVTAGVLVIYVRNFGRLVHNLVITRDGVKTGSTNPIWPGQSVELAVSLTPGTYSMASTLLSDQALGTYGTLEVTG